GQVLIQSDDAIVQYLPPGTYALSVSAASGSGAYQLTSELIQASAPSGPVLDGFWLSEQPSQIVAADLNAHGISDLVPPHFFRAKRVRVVLGNGDGTFGPPQTLSVGAVPTSVAVADVNGDGKPDLVACNQFGDKFPSSSDGTVSVLLGNGDGTFQPQQTFAV